jgi:hypothetical protein
MTGAVDPVDHLLVAVGNGEIEAFSLAGNTVGQVTIPAASGDLTAQNGASPGFAWDSAINEFVGWNGGSTLYTLDPHSWQWTAHAAAAGSATPTAPAGNGTFGRFQYDAANNEFVVVNDINQDVFVFQSNLTGSTSSAPLAQAASVGTISTGSNTNGQIAQLISAMASFPTNNAGGFQTAAVQMPSSDPSLLNTLAVPLQH